MIILLLIITNFEIYKNQAIKVSYLYGVLYSDLWGIIWSFGILIKRQYYNYKIYNQINMSKLNVDQNQLKTYFRIIKRIF